MCVLPSMLITIGSLNSILSSLLLPASLEALSVHFLLLIAQDLMLGLSYKEKRLIFGSWVWFRVASGGDGIFACRVPRQYRASMVRGLDKLL